MKKNCLLIMMLFGIGNALTAQLPPLSHCDINNVNATVLGNGCCFLNGLGTLCPTWEVPRGSGLNTIYQHSLWFGGLNDNDSLCLSAQRYGQEGEDYWSGPIKPVDVSTDMMNVMKYHHVWNITRMEIESFKVNYSNSGYVIPEDILTWPAHGDEGYAENLAPFVDVDGDGQYHPEKGDYPDIKGDRCLFYIFNECFKEHAESQGEKVGLEVHGMVYAFDTPDNEAINNTVFVNYKVFNRSASRYHDAYMGVFIDFDIGYGYDDYIGCDVRRGSCFAYNAATIDGDGGEGTYGDNPPVQVCTILAGPTIDADGRDNPGFSGNCESLFHSGYPFDRYAYNGFNFGNGVADDERYGMCGFVYFNNSSGPNSDPIGPHEYYNVIRGLLKNGQPMQYGGDAYLGEDVVGPECRFMFPGNSDPCNFGTYGIVPNGGYNSDGLFWTEEQCMNVPSDRRGLATFGPFTFASGKMEELDYAFVTVWKNDSQSAFDRKEEMIDQVRAFFMNAKEK